MLFALVMYIVVSGHADGGQPSLLSGLSDFWLGIIVAATASILLVIVIYTSKGMRRDKHSSVHRRVSDLTTKGKHLSYSAPHVLPSAWVFIPYQWKIPSSAGWEKCFQLAGW